MARLAYRATLTVLLVLGGCFVDPAVDLAELRLSVLLPDAAETALRGAREPDGLVHLETTGLFVQVVVWAADLETPAIATWPPESASVAPDAHPHMSLLVPAGPARIEILAYQPDGRAIRAWHEAEPLVLDLPGGRESTVEARLEPMQTATLSLALGGTNAEEVAVVWVVDGDPALGLPTGPGVAWPPVAVLPGELALTDLPAGRPLSLRLADADGRLLPCQGGPWTLRPGEVKTASVIVSEL